MTKNPPSQTPPAARKSADFNVALELADTTWRMAVPVVLLAGGGLWIDKSLDSAPWVTLLGMAAGFVVAALLVKRQISRGRKETK